MKIKIKHDAVEYELDMEKAITYGFLKKLPKIDTFSVGDVFELGSQRLVVTRYNMDDYVLIGRYGLSTFQDTQHIYSRDGVLEFLNKHEFKLIGNINGAFEKLVASLGK